MNKKRITEGKKEVGAKSLDSTNQPTAFQKGYARGIKAQEKRDTYNKAQRSWTNATPKAGFPPADDNVDAEKTIKKYKEERSGEETGLTEGFRAGVKDRIAAREHAKNKEDKMKCGGKVHKMKKGGSVKKCSCDGIAVRGKTRAR